MRINSADRQLVCRMDETIKMRDLNDGQIGHFAYLKGENAKEMVGGASCGHTRESIQQKAYFLGRCN